MTKKYKHIYIAREVTLKVNLNDFAKHAAKNSAKLTVNNTADSYCSFCDNVPTDEPLAIFKMSCGKEFSEAHACEDCFYAVMSEIKRRKKINEWRK